MESSDRHYPFTLKREVEPLCVLCGSTALGAGASASHGVSPARSETSSGTTSSLRVEHPLGPFGEVFEDRKLGGITGLLLGQRA